MNHFVLARLAILTVAFSCIACAQTPSNPDATASSAPSEMTKLAQALAGDWSNVETMERSERFPNGAGRHGTSHCELNAGGATLTCQGSSDGSAGRLDHMTVIWWDDHRKLYGFFICFKDWGSGCKVRGTAHWESDVFVNDYTENVKGKQTKMRDSWIDITPNSHTLVAAIETADGKMKTLITTRSTRR